LFRGRPGGRRDVRSGCRLSDKLTGSMFAGYMGVSIKTTANQVLFWKILYCTMSGKLLQSEAIFDSKCIKSVWQQRSSGPIDVAGKEKKGGEKRQRREQVPPTTISCIRHCHHQSKYYPRTFSGRFAKKVKPASEKV